MTGDVRKYVGHCFIIFINLQYRSQIFFQFVLKITSVRWRPSLSMHCTNRLLKLRSIRSSTLVRMFAMTPVMLFFKCTRVLGRSVYTTDLIYPHKKHSAPNLASGWPRKVSSQGDEALVEVFPQQFHGTRCRVSSVLVEPYVPRVHFFKFWKKKFSDHFRIAFRINCNGMVVFFKEVRANYPHFRKIISNSDPFTMQRLLMKFSLVFFPLQ